MAYAVDTKVPVERTRAEIEQLVTKHRCSAYLAGTDTVARKAMVQFRAENRIVRFLLTLPDPNEPRFRRHGHRRAPVVFEQAERSLWRALLLVIKAKLEAVESKIATFEEEFLAHIVMPNDRTVGQMVTPLVQHAYETGEMPMRLLPAGMGEVVETE